MNLNAILDRLQGVRRNGKGWMAGCPAHQDRNPSLSIRNENGKILLHCFGGCSIEAVCAALEIKVRDLFASRRETYKLEPLIVRKAQKQISGLRSHLSRRDRERSVTVVLADKTDLDEAIARALALAVEGELVQIALSGGGQ
jgi:CHC2 zinc finger